MADLFLWVVDAALWLCAYQPSEWQPVLSAAIDADQLPVEYGGTGPPLCERDHSHDVIVDVDDQPPLASPGTSLSSTMATAHDKVGRQTHRQRREGGEAGGGGGALADAHFGSEQLTSGAVLVAAVYVSVCLVAGVRAWLLPYSRRRLTMAGLAPPRCGTCPTCRPRRTGRWACTCTTTWGPPRQQWPQPPPTPAATIQPLRCGGRG